jgi:hypothetical protein
MAGDHIIWSACCEQPNDQASRNDPPRPAIRACLKRARRQQSLLWNMVPI